MRIDQSDYDEPEYDEPRSRMTVTAYTEGDRIVAHFWTNDNRDEGWPSESADWRLTFKSLDAFRRHAGTSRSGTTMDTTVHLDGVEMTSDEDYERAARP